MPALSERSQTTIIAVDGPAASGKGTLARRLADHLGLRHFDSGKLYRATTWRLLRGGGDPADPEQAVAAAAALGEEDHLAPELLDEAVGQAAALVAKFPAVRAVLLERQRALGRRPPGTVIDGRDIGTVVFPDATHKLFVTASLECRAERRWRELRELGVGPTQEAVLRDIAARDAHDKGRETAPLLVAPDAITIDTTDLDRDAALAAALAAIGQSS